MSIEKHPPVWPFPTYKGEPYKPAKVKRQYQPKPTPEEFGAAPF